MFDLQWSHDTVLLVNSIRLVLDEAYFESFANKKTSLPPCSLALPFRAMPSVPFTLIDLASQGSAVHPITRQMTVGCRRILGGGGGGAPKQALCAGSSSGIPSARLLHEDDASPSLPQCPGP